MKRGFAISKHSFTINKIIYNVKTKWMKKYK